MAHFIKLTDTTDRKRELYFNVDQIVGFFVAGGVTHVVTANAEATTEVRESPNDILAVIPAGVSRCA